MRRPPDQSARFDPMIMAKKKAPTCATTPFAVEHAIAAPLVT